MSKQDPKVGEYVVQIFWITDKPWLIGVMAGKVIVKVGNVVEVNTISMEEVSLN